MVELFSVPAGLLNDDRLGWALEALAPVAEQVRGELAPAAASGCSADPSQLHLDMTAVRFTGGMPARHGRQGGGADRTIARQVKTMQVSAPAGAAAYHRPHPGASNEAPCFTDTLERIRELAPPGVVCVIDSGFGHLSKLCAADAEGLRFVVPLRADTGWAQWFAADVDGGVDALPDSSTASNANDLHLNCYAHPAPTLRHPKKDRCFHEVAVAASICEQDSCGRSIAATYPKWCRHRHLVV